MASAADQRDSSRRPELVGVGVIVVRGDKVLLGLRLGAHGGGTWSFPGGHVDDGESAEACALRELEEETGLRAVNPRRVGDSEDVFPEGLRFRTIFVRVDWVGGEPAVREPDLCERWSWFRWDDAPEPLFLPVAGLRAKGLPLTRVGSLEAIHIATAAGVPVRAVDEIRAIVGVGLERDRYANGLGHYQDERVSRDLTLIEAEAVEAIAHEHAIALSPGETRRNLTTRGVGLNELVGRRFWVGDVLCLGTRLCEPCQYLADLIGKPLLRSLVHRGGLRADIVHGGLIRVGDQVRPADE
jgi:ADP-ribose pyrophosphatase YjhB (NUDIX family)/MOSC domain-containing protein YiiM